MLVMLFRCFLEFYRVQKQPNTFNCIYKRCQLQLFFEFSVFCWCQGFSIIDSSQDHEVLQITLNNIVSRCSSNAKMFIFTVLCHFLVVVRDPLWLQYWRVVTENIKQYQRYWSNNNHYSQFIRKYYIHITAKTSSALGFTIWQKKDFESLQTWWPSINYFVGPLLENSTMINHFTNISLLICWRRFRLVFSQCLGWDCALYTCTIQFPPWKHNSGF